MSGTHGGTWADRGSRLVPSLTGDPKTQVRRRGGLDRLHGCRLDAPVARVLEHPGAAADEYGYEAHRDLVDESRPDRLLSDLGAADIHVLVAGVFAFARLTALSIPTVLTYSQGDRDRSAHRETGGASLLERPPRSLAAHPVAQVQHPIAPDDHVGVFQQVLAVHRPEVPLAGAEHHRNDVHRHFVH